MKSEEDVKMTVTSLLINDRVQVTFWNPDKGEFQTITGSKAAFQEVD